MTLAILENALFWYAVGTTILVIVLLLERRGMVSNEIVDKVIEAVPKDYAVDVSEKMQHMLLNNDRRWDDVLAHIISLMPQVFIEPDDEGDIQ